MKRQIAIALALLAPLAPAWGELRIAGVLGDNMVLQRDAQVKIWGLAEPGEQVRVRFGAQAKAAQAGEFGRWSVALDPMDASAERRELTVKAKSGSITLANVVVGDVWLFLGQGGDMISLQREYNRSRGSGGVLNIDACTAEDAAAGANSPVVRILKIGRKERDDPGIRPAETFASRPGRWGEYTPKGNWAYFERTSYFLARTYWRQLKVPLGVLVGGVGDLEAMTPPAGFAEAPELADLAAKVLVWQPTTPRGRAAYLKTLADIRQWSQDATAKLADPKTTYKDLTQPPLLPGPPTGVSAPTTFYNRVLNPAAGMTIRGAWLSPGLENLSDELYAVKVRALVAGLRSVFGGKGLPVCLFQMRRPMYYEVRDNPEPDIWVNLRRRQQAGASLAGADIVATYDFDRDRRDSRSWARRMATWAMAVATGAGERTGPTCRSYRIEGNEAVVKFDHAGKGLMAGKHEVGRPAKPAENAAPGGFEIAGADGKWHKALAVIDKDCVKVSCPGVPKPAAVRYAFAAEPAGANLYNRDGLPALPFLTAGK